jgi:hypothetical protein
MKDRVWEALNLGLRGNFAMTKGVGQRKEGAGNMFCSRRKGFALQLALIVILVGSILVVAIYEFTSMALKGTTGRSVVYGDQMLVAGHAEKAKGAVLSEMKRIGAAIHPRIGSMQYTELPVPGQTIAWQANRPEVHSVDQLQIKFDAPPLNSALSSLVSDDRMEGGRRVVLQVFDLTYDATQISSMLVANPAAVQNLPPALSLNSKQKGKGNGVGNEGMTDGAPDKVDPVDDLKGQELDLARFGAYLIRTRIFEADKLVRVTEEAFFQVLQE